MKKTLIIWRRLGKEHGENAGYRLNPEDVVKHHLDEKQEKFQKTEGEKWSWWQINESLLVETSENTDQFITKETFYYLPHKNWLLVDNFDCRDGLGWKWYIHIGKMAYDDMRNCWIFTDWFSDVLVMPDNVTHTVLDLDDLGQGYSLGLITSEEMIEILISTQDLVDTIRNGKFPPAEIEEWKGS